jgi:hypothetical protein
MRENNRSSFSFVLLCRDRQKSAHDNNILIQNNVAFGVICLIDESQRKSFDAISYTYNSYPYSFFCF